MGLLQQGYETYCAMEASRMGKYIDGEKELRDINMEFHPGYVSGEEVPGRRSCPM